ncbi:MAG: T9SS type A sorting domain-containing protein [Bacteroidota bacterium]
MRNLIFTLLLLLSGQLVLAQSQEITKVLPAKAPIMATASAKAQVVDTLDDYLVRATAFYTLAAADGYVMGTNPGILETASHYDNPGGSTTITEAVIFGAAKTIMGGMADSVTVNVYPAGPDSMPGGLAISSGKFSMTDLDTSGFATFVPLTSTAPAPGGFLVSVVHDLGSIDDTLAILANNVLAMGGGPDGMGEKRLRQNTVQGWLRGFDIWNIANAPLDADALIIPIIDVTPVNVDPATVSGFQLWNAYPNPAVRTVRVPFNLDAPQTVGITLIDATGRIIAKESAAREAGLQEWELDVTQLATGYYYYIVQASGQALGGKFLRTE